MKLFKVNAGSYYWVAADEVPQAIGLVREQLALTLDKNDLAESMADASAEELSEESARKEPVHDDGTGGDLSLWDLFLREAKGGTLVIACSEWD